MNQEYLKKYWSGAVTGLSLIFQVDGELQNVGRGQKSLVLQPLAAGVGRGGWRGVRWKFWVCWVSH